MISKWELLLNEIFWPALGAYLGAKVHPFFSFVLFVAGFIFAEYIIYQALTNGLVKI